MPSASDEIRNHFRLAADGFVIVVGLIPPGSWERPGLGVWTVRDLAGHASRALLTVETYLDPLAVTDRPALADPVAYLQAAGSGLVDPETVAERGRQAGAALGEQPAPAVSVIAERVLAMVRRSTDDAVVETRVGSMTLIGYLPTRTFELVVHSLDLVAAIGVAVPAEFAEPTAACLQLAAGLAAAMVNPGDVLLALTGRRPLPDGFSVL
jgi:Mycothiol maleylpyruvate isomerase N-terminal domain